MLLRSRLRTTTYMCRSTLGMHTNMPFHPQKYFTPTLGGNTKTILVGIIALKFFNKSFSIFPGYRREVCGYAK